ncbi:hypothetical protein [Dubosiella newyorkensis]|uniref:ParB/Sulfiredoxin domain-containing protein n=1 Tax=Dubosiella newyorkensis TaxID=1862672 RepID=A0A1U7NMZ3_9FIRM|nr:hypothetical protein [Dubosiella newyorkensis]OLU46624.1 hypothetical protein BO225_05485 [Dubosiella newyorkensis]
MKNNVERREISLSSLVIFAENPRHEPAENEEKAMELLWIIVGSQKMVNLAKDIAENGLNPNELPILVPLASKKGKFEVYDGNRRLTALRILSDPDKYDFISTSQKSKLKSIAQTNLSRIPKKVFACITSQEHALSLIKKTHTGVDSGRGRTPWGAEEIRRFELKYGTRKDTTDYILEKANEYFEIDNLTKRLSITSIRRIFFASVKNALGFDEKNPASFTKDRICLAIKLIEKAAEEDNSGNKVSRWHAADAEKMLMPIIKEEIISRPLSPIPEPIAQNSGKTSTNNATKGNKDKSDKKEGNSNKSKEDKPEPPKVPYFMEGLDLSGLSKNEQGNHGIISIGNELLKISKNKAVDNYPLASAMLLRSLVEAVLIRHLKTKTDEEGKPHWSHLANETNGYPSLSKIIKYYGKCHQGLLDHTHKRTFDQCLGDQSKVIEPINLLIHHPEKFREPEYKIKDWPKLGLLDLLNYLIKEISGQNAI